MLFQTPTKYGSDRFRQILIDHWEKWWDYRREEIPADHRAYVQKMVEKMMGCRNPQCGYARYVCPKCYEERIVPFSCKTRFCPSCGKVRTDEWVGRISQELLDVPHLHLTLTIAKEMRRYFDRDRSLLKLLLTTATDAAAELVRIRRAVADLAAENDLAIIAAGTHPFHNPFDSEQNTSTESNLGIKQDSGILAAKHLTFSTHVHITIEDREFLVDAMNVARYLMPHILSLSTSSPFWLGRNTGMKSYRSLYLRNFARTGTPRIFNSWADYTTLVDTLIKTESLKDGGGIKWDIRPNWDYPTLEFRICDVCTRVQEAVCVAALFQAIIAKLWKLRYDNMTFRIYPAELIDENKWRAARQGLDGTLIDFGKQREAPTRELINELVSWFIDDVVDDLGCRKEVLFAYQIMEDGTSADRQLAALERRGDIRDVVKQLISETNDLPEL